MREEKLMDAMEYVDDQLLESAADSMAGKRKRGQWKPLAAMAACLAMVVGLFWYNRFPPVPKYENAIFSAEQIGELFPAKDAMGTNAYTEEGYPNEELFVVPEVLDVEYLNIYKQIGTEPSEAELRSLIKEVFPYIGKMYGCDVSQTLFVRKASATGYSAETVSSGKRILASSDLYSLSVSWGNDDLSPLSINGETFYAKNVQTDEEIMASVSSVIPYLEQVFDTELSAYKIDRSYSSSDADINYLNVWLYSETQVTDELLEQYDREPTRYCTGAMICLEFSREDLAKPSDTVVCRYISYEKSIQHRYKAYAQCRMISLDEAEALLANGYVFSNHVCKLCMDMQEQVDFSDYDRVSLEYVFGEDYSIPFYTFYKKIREDEDGFVQYAKTMVPAIEVSGLEEYFEEQQRYHISW